MGSVVVVLNFMAQMARKMKLTTDVEKENWEIQLAL